MYQKFPFKKIVEKHLEIHNFVSNFAFNIKNISMQQVPQNIVNKLTVLIPFMNEGEEVAATVRDVRRTAGERVDILVVNDCSTDGYDYKKDLEQYNVTYLENKENWLQLCKI